MRYPIAIEIGTETVAYGVVMPDLPGCFSAGDTLDEAVTTTEEAAAAWIDATLDAGDAVPAPSSIEAVSARPEYAGWAFGFVAVDRAAVESTGGAGEHHAAPPDFASSRCSGTRRRRKSLRIHRPSDDGRPRRAGRVRRRYTARSRAPQHI